VFPFLECWRSRCGWLRSGDEEELVAPTDVNNIGVYADVLFYVFVFISYLSWSHLLFQYSSGCLILLSLRL
jgi:hypothetical protein